MPRESGLRDVASPSIQIGGRIPTGTEESFQTTLFGDVCRRIWGPNTDAKIAVIARCTPRAAREYLNGNVGAPPSVFVAILTELARRPK